MLSALTGCNVRLSNLLFRSVFLKKRAEVQAIRSQSEGTPFNKSYTTSYQSAIAHTIFEVVHSASP